MFSCDYCEIFKKSFFYRTTPVTVSVAKQNKMATKRKPLQINFYGSRAIVSVENCPSPNPKTNPKPSPNPNRGAIFLGGNCLVGLPNPKTNTNLGEGRQLSRHRPTIFYLYLCFYKQSVHEHRMANCWTTFRVKPSVTKATIKTADKEKLSFSFTINVK